MTIVRTLLRMALFWLPAAGATLALVVARARIPADSPPRMTMLGEERLMPWLLGGVALGVLLLVLGCVLPRGHWRPGLRWLPIALVVFVLLSWIIGTQPVPRRVAWVLVMVLAPLLGSGLAEWFTAPMRRTDRREAGRTRR